MKKLLLLLIIPLLSFGQDEGYGSNLKPFKDGTPYTEKIIQLKKNTLEFNIGNAKINTKAVFHFFNPLAETKTIQVGFVYMGCRMENTGDSGDGGLYPCDPEGVKDEWMDLSWKGQENQIYWPDSNNPNWSSIDDIMVIVSGQKKEVNIERLENGPEYVFLFDVNFEPGITIIEHSYVTNISQGFSFGNCQGSYDYISYDNISLWANNEIGDFTLKLSSAWEFIDSELINTLSENLMFSGLGRQFTKNTIRLQTGELIVQTKNIKTNRTTDEWSYDDPYNFLGIRLYKNLFDYDCQDGWGEWADEHEDQISLSPIVGHYLNKSDARIYRNLLFALNGHVFKSEDLQTLFNKQLWYIPNKNKKVSISDFSDQEKYYYDYISSVEKNNFPPESKNVREYLLLNQLGMWYDSYDAEQGQWGLEDESDWYSFLLNEVIKIDPSWKFGDFKFQYKNQLLHIWFQNHHFICTLNSNLHPTEIRKN